MVHLKILKAALSKFLTSSNNFPGLNLKALHSSTTLFLCCAFLECFDIPPHLSSKIKWKQLELNQVSYNFQGLSLKHLFIVGESQLLKALDKVSQKNLENHKQMMQSYWQTWWRIASLQWLRVSWLINFYYYILIKQNSSFNFF